MTTVVLLGAGASAEAGIPMTSGMTRAIAERVAEQSRRGEADALSWIRAAMAAHDAGRRIDSPTDLDIERVFSAVQLLAERDELEVTPFVAAWNPAVDGFDSLPSRPGLPSFIGSTLLRAIKAERDRDVESVMEDVVKAARGERTTGVYSALLDAMLRALRDVVKINDAEKVRYLEPVFDLQSPFGALTIATLNYDQSVELAGQVFNKPVTTGIESWSSGKGGSFGGRGINLLKLHGSADWCVEDQPTEAGMLPQGRFRIASDPLERALPAVVFGQRGKLRADGPFLELLNAFDSALSMAARLLVVGYSFRDAHVNEYIRRWINEDRSRAITVIDPHFPERPGWGTFQDDLMRCLVAPDFDPQRFETRLAILREPASTGLLTYAADD